MVGKSEPLVSIIVPAFNMEPYITQCLNSLFQQTLRNLQIIVVDDGSTDGTCEVVRSLEPPLGVSIELMSQPNAGLGSARNAGLRVARGQWIGFVDSDDWVSSQMYETLMIDGEKSGADMALTQGCLFDHQTRSVSPWQDISMWKGFIADHGRLINPREAPDVFLLDPSTCRRLYKRYFLQTAQFKFVNFLYEDVLAHYKLLLRCEKVCLIDEPHYFYRNRRPEQITLRTDSKLLDSVFIMRMVVDELKGQHASDDIWARFILTQSWFFLWLCQQIDDLHLDELIAGAIEIAEAFPAPAVRLFRQKFVGNTRAAFGVELQLQRAYDKYKDFVIHGDK